MNTQEYHFPNLDIHAAIIVQRSIEQRKNKMTETGSEALLKGDKALKAAIEEMDQIHLDLDRHISAAVREQEGK